MTVPTKMPNQPSRYANGRFGPGNSGRPIGARNRATQQALLSIMDDFEANKRVVLQRMREYFTTDYLRILASLLPSRIEIAQPAFEEYSEAEAAVVVSYARAALQRIEEGRGSLSELGAAVLAEPVLGTSQTE
ncbi:MAG TPA: hypothetical protein VGS12_13395 [Caulobacteraceae bacterium]|nr:hypothetical protein [Caulobacteraceae bacterium]